VAASVTRCIFGDTLNLDREVGPDLTKMANHILGEPLLELSFDRRQVALTKWGPCGPVSEGHGFQAANGEDAYRHRQPLSLCTRNIDPNVGGLGHARLQRTALSNTAFRWYSRNRRCPDENAPTLTVSRVGAPVLSNSFRLGDKSGTRIHFSG
jgi:hypothetical protein